MGFFAENADEGEKRLEAILEELRPTLPKNITFKSVQGAFNEQLYRRA
jgi:hypothetical protein